MLENSSPNIQLKKADKIAMAVIAAVVLAMIAVPVLTWFSTITALLVVIMENTLYFFGMLGALLLGGAYLWENRTALLYKWKNLARNTRRAVARENPIGVMDTAISRFTTKLTTIDENVVKADAARRQQQKAIGDMKKKSTESQKMADAALSMQKSDSEIARHATAADRWSQAAIDVQPQADKLTEIHEKMQQARVICYERLEDMKNQREVFKMRYDTLMAGSKAIKGFKSFFGANPDLEMLQLSIEEIDRQTMEAEAEIDQFMRDIQPGIDANNLQKAAAEQAAMARMRPQVSVKTLPTASPSLNLQRLTSAPIKDAVIVDRQ